MRAAAFAAIFLSLFLTSCAAQSPSGPHGPPTGEQIKQWSVEQAELGNTEVAEALRDGVVTFSEYSEAFDNLRACVEGRGYGITDPILSLATNTHFDFSYDSLGRSHDIAGREVEECEWKYWMLVSMIYVDSTPQQMDPGLRAAVDACLQAKGIELDPDAATIWQMVKATGEEEKVNSCLADESFARTPGLSSAWFPLGPEGF